MKILITGCCGFIGYHLTTKLLNKYNVIGLDNLSNYYSKRYKLRRLKELKKIKKFKFIKLDLSNKHKLNQIFKKKKFDIVINLAAQPGVRLSISNPEKYYKNNILSFYNLIECIKQKKIRHFIFASSSSVYGNQIKYPVNENGDISKPLSFYGASKVCNEAMAYSFSNMYKIPTTCLRFFTVYGPENRPDMALYKFTKKILADEKIELYNNGNYQRDFTYISDIIDSISRLLNKPPKKSIPYHVFNIGRSKPQKVKKFINSIINQLNSKYKNQKNLKRDNNNEPLITYSNSKKLAKYINFSPKIDLEKGIFKFIKWYKNK